MKPPRREDTKRMANTANIIELDPLASKLVDCAFQVHKTLGPGLLELKSAEVMNPVYQSQILTFMKISKARLGLLINFNVPLIKNGIKRFVL